jgi:hypothetical protein
MSRIAHFHSLSSAEIIKQIAESKKGRPSRNIYMLPMTQKFYATDSQTIKKKIFLRPLAAPSYLSGALGVRPRVPPPLAAKGQVPLQRLPRDKLETSRACRIPNFITATASRQAVSSLWRTCLEFVGNVSSKSQTNSRRLEFDASLLRV